MASSSRGVEPINSPRLRKRQYQGSSHTPALTSDNNQSDEPAAEIYQSAVSDWFCWNYAEFMTCWGHNFLWWLWHCSGPVVKRNSCLIRRVQVLSLSLPWQRSHSHWGSTRSVTLIKLCACLSFSLSFRANHSNLLSVLTKSTLENSHHIISHANTTSMFTHLLRNSSLGWLAGLLDLTENLLLTILVITIRWAMCLMLACVRFLLFLDRWRYRLFMQLWKRVVIQQLLLHFRRFWFSLVSLFGYNEWVNTEMLVLHKIMPILHSRG